MPNFPATFFMNADFQWFWCLLSPSGVFLAISVDSYESHEEAKRSYELACLSMKQAA